MNSGRNRRSHSTSAVFEPLESRALLSTTISGMVFADSDVDGRRDLGEKGIENQRVFLDVNFDGQLSAGEPSIFTNSKGEYTFSNLTAGVWRVRLIVPTGNRQTSPGKLFYDITATGIGNDIHVANDFGLTDTAVVKGIVFNDANGDGARQITEGGVSGILVYIDKNKNGKFDAGSEKSRLTDTNGSWRFAGLKAGTYQIRVNVPKSITVTTPSKGFLSIKVKKGQSLSNRLFGLH